MEIRKQGISKQDCVSVYHLLHGKKIIFVQHVKISWKINHLMGVTDKEITYLGISIISNLPIKDHIAVLIFFRDKIRYFPKRLRKYFDKDSVAQCWDDEGFIK